MPSDAPLRNLTNGVVKVILVLASLAVLGWVLDAFAGFPVRVPFEWRLLGLVPFATGAILEIVATRRLWTSGGGTPNPVDPPRQLVTNGPYRRSRNPLYLARLLILTGFTVLLSSVGLAVVTVGLLLLLQLIIVPREESRLIDRYGAKYIDYRSTVPRWFALRLTDGRGRQSPPS
jgi:protein-S-isoprenylcysteine O-methyltransferase Ste14